MSPERLIWSRSALCHRPRDGYILLVIPQPVRLTSVCISGFKMLIWWHDLSVLLIYQCISDTAFADKLSFPAKLPL